MRILFIILAFLTADSVVGQRSFDQMSQKAFDFYIKKNFDSSLFYYLEISEDYPRNQVVYISNRVADSYLALDDTANAEKYYLKCLSFDREMDPTYFSQTNSCRSLSEIYFNRKQFRLALLYMDYSKTKYKPLRMICAGGFGYVGRLFFAYKKSLCYYGLNKKDSAIIVLAPHIFIPRDNYAIDSLEFEKLLDYFVNTVFEVYGCTAAKNDMQNGINHLTYKPLYDDSHKTIMFSLDCAVTFAKAKIDLFNGGVQVDKMGDVPDLFSKEDLLKDFTDTPAYKYIMAGKDQPSPAF